MLTVRFLSDLKRHGHRFGWAVEAFQLLTHSTPSAARQPCAGGGPSS